MASAPVAEEATIDRLGREAFVTLFVAGDRFTADIEACCRMAGVSHSQYVALWVLCLSDAPEGVPMGALVDGLLSRKADATRLVDRLVAQGLATRAGSTSDRRVVLVAPTEAGRTCFERLTAQIKALHRRQWAALSESEIRQLTHLLNKALWADPALTSPLPT